MLKTHDLLEKRIKKDNWHRKQYSYTRTNQKDNKMVSPTLSNITEIFYFFGVKFHGLSISTRIIFAVFYVFIIISSAILNGLLLYVFVTKSKLRKPSYLVVSTLLWNSILLILTVLPLTLLQICINDVAKNHDIVAIQTYFTMSYIWMSFSSITLIGLSRAQKIKRRLMSLNYNNHWTDFMLLVGGGIASVLMPFTTAVVLFYYGKKASIILALIQLLLITLLLFVSYGIIIHTVKKSHQKWKALQDGHQILDQHEKTLRKVKRTVLLVTGGYIFTLIPFICGFVVEVYNVYNKRFQRDHDVFRYTFRAAGDMILYMNTIINPIIYFYTNTDLQEEVGKLSITKHIRIRLKSLKAPSNNA